MKTGRIIAGLSLSTLAIAGALATPALGSPDPSPGKAVRVTSSVTGPSGIGTFTPAAADPRLAAVLARGGIGSSGFRFTPTESKRNGGRSVTVAVRTRTSRSSEAAERSTGAAGVPQGLTLAPIAYNLGVSVGWRRFALTGDVARVDLAGAPGSREAMGLGVTYAGKRVTGQVRAAADRPLPGAPRLVDDQSVSLDVGGSYRLTRNLDVTAGVRYRSERERLARLEDTKRDSQAV